MCGLLKAQQPMQRRFFNQERDRESALSLLQAQLPMQGRIF